MNFSYERVSTTRQDVGRQDLALERFKIDKRYVDKRSGKNAIREALNRLRLDVRQGDNIYVESISRLGRNVDDLRALCREFKEKGVTIHFIREGLNTDGDTYKFLLTILGAVAEMEREQTIENVCQGIEKARKYGTKSGKPLGRPQATISKDFEKYYRRWRRKEITALEFARFVGVGRTTLYRHIKIYEE